MNSNITGGVIWKQLLLFFFPIWFGTFFQQLYNTADAVIVGNFVGKGALAAVGTTAVVQNLLVGFFVGVASGASVVISQYYGARQGAQVQRAVHTAMAMALLGGVGIMLIGFAASRRALSIMNTPADVMKDAVLYLRICFLGMVPSLIYNMGTGILRAVGDSKRPLYFLICASLTNIVLDVVLVAVLGMGVAGAALATVASQCVAAGMTVMSLTHTTACYRFVPSYLRLDKEMVEKIVRIGLPAGLQSVMYSLSNSVVQASINSFGTDVVAAYTAYGKIDSIFWMTMNSFGLSITTFVGQNFGAGRYDRVKKGVRQCALMAFVATGMLMAVTLAFGSVLFRLFVQDAPVIEQGVEILHYVVPFWPTYVLIEILSGSVRGAGDSLIPMIMTSIGVCVTRILWVLTVVATVWHTLIGALACYPISWTLTSLFFLVYYIQGGWLRRRIRIREAAQTEQPA